MTPTPIPTPPSPLTLLRHHVSGAIARGEAEAIVEQPAPRTLNITITEPGMRRALQMFRRRLAAEAGIVDCIIDLAFSMGANCAGVQTVEDGARIRAERERILDNER